MKSIDPAAMDAIEAGGVIVSGAIEIIPLDAQAIPEILEGFTGLSWLLPCTAPFDAFTCHCGAGSSDDFIVAGDPEVTYDVTFRIRGVVELDTYSGGTPSSPSYVYLNATGHGYAPANTYKLIVSDPAVTYYLNNGTFSGSGLTTLDYQITVSVVGGATITLQSLSNDNFEVKNQTNASAPDDDPLYPIVVTQPYDGQFLQLDAVAVDVTNAPVRIWGGHGPIDIDGNTYQGVGDRSLIQRTSNAIGGTAQGLKLTLSGVEPYAIAVLDTEEVKGASVVIHRLIFASDGKTLLDSSVFDRGRIDAITTVETIGDTATIEIDIESAARGLGHAGARQRSDSDQRLIGSSDGYFKNTAYAAEKKLYWGGKKPNRAGTVLTISDTAGGE